MISPALREELATGHALKQAAGFKAKKTRERKLQVGAADDVELRPHQRAYAQWLATQFEKPKEKAKKTKIAALAHMPMEKISRRYIANLEAREDFRALVTQYEGSYIEQAKGIIEQSYVEGAHVYNDSLKEARRRLKDSPETFDLRVVSGLVQPALERAAPRKSEGPGTAVQINIALSSQQAALLDTPLPVVDYEMVDPAP